MWFADQFPELHGLITNLEKLEELVKVGGIHCGICWWRCSSRSLVAPQRATIVSKVSWESTSHCIIIVIDCYFIIFLNFRYTLLHVLEFDSTRKRMSVIVKSPQGFDIIWYRSNFFRRNNPLGMLFSRVLLTSDIRLRLAHPSWVCRNAFPVPLLVRLSILLKSVEYQLLVCLRKGRHFWRQNWDLSLLICHVAPKFVSLSVFTLI